MSKELIVFISGLTTGLFLFIVLLLVIIILFFRANSKDRLIKKIGRENEKSINQSLKVWAKQTDSIFIDNSLYKYDENKVFEIDSILITSRAILVVEIKSINGIIKGDSLNKQWKKILGKNTFDIDNPILQNNRHIEHLIRIVKEKVPMVSLIVFSNRAEKLEIENIPEHVVLTSHKDLYKNLDSIQSILHPKIKPEEMQNLNKKIKSFKTNKLSDISLYKSIKRENRYE